MKKTMIIGAIVIALLCVMTQLGGISHAGPRGIAGSAHDMSQAPPDTSSGTFKYLTSETCVFCHTPHGANTDMNDATFWDQSAAPAGMTVGTGQPLVLWNRGLGHVLTTSVQAYTSSSMDAVQSGDAEFGDIWAYSLMCLSCHDGVSAINVLQKNPSGLGPGAIPTVPLGKTYIGAGADAPNMLDINIGERIAPGPTGDKTTHLENDHPISINYVQARANEGGNTGLKDPTLFPPEVRLFPLPSNPTQRVALECSSCHDVHNEGSPDPGSDADVRYKHPFLNVKTEGSALCSVCHLK